MAGPRDGRGVIEGLIASLVEGCMVDFTILEVTIFLSGDADTRIGGPSEYPCIFATREIEDPRPPSPNLPGALRRCGVCTPLSLAGRGAVFVNCMVKAVNGNRVCQYL